jgi:hypothetical protein
MTLVSKLKQLLLIAAISVAGCCGTVYGQPVKWNPGHYIQLNAKAGDFLVENTFKEISTLPNVRGVQTRYAWTALEPSKGIYDFSQIDKHVAWAQAYNKRLAIMISTKAFSAGGQAVPDYMRTAAYEYGTYKITIDGKDTVGTEDTTGENMALYNNAVRDRLIALTQALGRRYNASNVLEAVAFNETAMGQAVTPLTSAQKQSWFNNLAIVNAATRKAFPNTVVMQFVNFPRAYTVGLVDSMMVNGTALGGPDTFVNAADLEAQTYPFYDTADATLAIGPSVQAENYSAEYQFGPYVAVDVKNLYNFARTRLHANYIFWSKTTADGASAGRNPYAEVLKMFKDDSFNQWAAGGLNTACPAVYESCVKKLP